MSNIFKYLKSFSTIPLEVDRLIVSAFMQVNKMEVEHNVLLRQYSVDAADTDDNDTLQAFVGVIKKENIVFDVEKLIELFEFVISPSDRIVTGAVYTPLKIREYIVNQCIKSKREEADNVTIADIACGCGGFLLTAAQELKAITGRSYHSIFREQIFGLDIQDYSITRTKLLLSLLALSEGEDRESFDFNLFIGDSLIFKWEDHYDNYAGFDIIVGNPPYVCARNLDDYAKQNLKNWSVCATGNPDLYIPFFQIGFENLSNNGILGFITMNTFFKSVNGRALRGYFAQNQVKLRIIDFGTLQIFKSKSTYTCICFIDKAQRNFIRYYRSRNSEFPGNENAFERIPYSALDAEKGWNPKDHKIVSKIESVGRPFARVYNTRHGIATLRNDVYIFSSIKEDEDYFYLQTKEEVYPIEKGICRDILNSNLLSRELILEEAVEKVIFPYRYETKTKLIEEHTFRETYPKAYAYLEAKKTLLAGRDKEKGNYENWYAFGRTQSLERVQNKLFFPKMSDQPPHCIVNTDENLLFYNGQAIIGHTVEDMIVIKKIMESRLFWYYIKTTSKPYSSNYYSLNGNYINYFGICDLSDAEREFLLREDNRGAIDTFLEEKYRIRITDAESDNAVPL